MRLNCTSDAREFTVPIPELTRGIMICIFIHMKVECDSRKIIQRLKLESFELVAVKGSHHKFRKGTITVIVPHPKKELPLGTARQIAKIAGWI